MKRYRLIFKTGCIEANFESPKEIYDYLSKAGRLKELVNYYQIGG